MGAQTLEATRSTGGAAEGSERASSNHSSTTGMGAAQLPVHPKYSTLPLPILAVHVCVVQSPVFKYTDFSVQFKYTHFSVQIYALQIWALGKWLSVLPSSSIC